MATIRYSRRITMSCYWVLVCGEAFLVALRGVVDGDRQAKASEERFCACKSRAVSWWTCSISSMTGGHLDQLLNWFHPIAAPMSG
jgi:hypothetical protein